MPLTIGSSARTGTPVALAAAPGPYAELLSDSNAETDSPEASPLMRERYAACVLTCWQLESKHVSKR